MAILSRQVLSDTGQDWNKLSDPIKAAGWYGRTAGLHTISFTMRNFVGRIYVIATLENSPELADANDGWFPIYLSSNGNAPWVELPTQYDACTQPILPISKYGYQTTGTFCDTFFGNFTYIKVGLDRDYLLTSPEQVIESSDRIAVGNIEQVLMNF